ncbi:hypothetical protein D623_10019835 [Myotis brandtii]|uniref:Uncharacterized protein n=1 Tax=Myotis brandtii TaxID=109478 RepID=S7NQK4_MYOBR|nr:hypothetical protein D623_10019835 [Myotis brandtii]
MALPSHVSPSNPPRTGGFKLELLSLTPQNACNAAAKTPSLLVYPPRRCSRRQPVGVAPLKIKIQWERSRGSLRRKEASSPFGGGRGPGDGRLGAGKSRLASTPSSHVGVKVSTCPAEDAQEAMVQ